MIVRSFIFIKNYTDIMQNDTMLNQLIQIKCSIYHDLIHMIGLSTPNQQLIYQRYKVSVIQHKIRHKSTENHIIAK